MAFLNMVELGSGASITYPIGRSRLRPSFRGTDGSPVDLKSVDTVWYRRPHRLGIPASVRDPEDRRFAYWEWMETINGILLSLTARFVNDPIAQRSAVKPRQLEVAHHIGLRVPDTLISNDPTEVEAFLQHHGGVVVHKAMTAPAHCFVDTQLWREEIRSIMHRDLPIAPAIFQEYVSGPADIRATIIGDRIFAARIATIQSRARGVDSRLDMDVPYEPHQLPASLSTLLLKLMSELGLVFGTVDLKMVDENEYVFLEINPQGQFLYVEILTRMPITSALADLLACPWPVSVSVTR